MTVKEVIKKLKELPEDAIVVVRGYEGGCNEVDEINIVMIRLNQHTKEYYGKHEIISMGEDPKSINKKYPCPIKAIFIDSSLSTYG
jgi:hypothetical protein